MLNLFRLIRSLISVGEGLIFEIFRLRQEISQLASEITKLREVLASDPMAERATDPEIRVSVVNE